MTIERGIRAVDSGNGGISGVTMMMMVVVMVVVLMMMIKCEVVVVVVVEESFFFIGEVEEVIDNEIGVAGFVGGCCCSVVEIGGFHEVVFFSRFSECRENW